MPTRDTVKSQSGIPVHDGIDDGIMRKSQINASLTEMEIERNKVISRVRYKIEQYFGITHNIMGLEKPDLQPY